LTVKRRVRSAPLRILLITSSVADCGMVPLNAALCPVSRGPVNCFPGKLGRPAAGDGLLRAEQDLAQSG
jgi:hypothetical protein